MLIVDGSNTEAALWNGTLGRDAYRRGAYRCIWMVTFQSHVKVPFLMSLNPSNAPNPLVRTPWIILVYSRHNMGVMLCGWLILPSPT
jgi:hypothetical protein